MSRKFLPLVSLALLSLLPFAAHAARHALLIGNDSYQEVPTLRNARADAQAMAAALQQAGYAVTVTQDRSLKEMKDDVRNFRSRIKGGDEVIFFYSGHGVQIEAMNYLLPVDVRAESEDQVRDDALALSRVLEDIREQKPALTMAVIDACRDNPFKGTGRAIGGRGLTGVGGANGQMVIYSAGEGQQALDRLSDGDPVKNGLFTRVFIREMTQPGVPIDQVARKVRAEVNRMAKTVNHEQVPAIYDQVIGEFYFYAQNDTVDEVEILFWQSMADSSDPAELQAYLDKYPDGQFAALAQARIKRIEQGAAVPAAAPSATPASAPAVSAPAPVQPQAPAAAVQPPAPGAAIQSDAPPAAAAAASAPATPAAGEPPAADTAASGTATADAAATPSQAVPEDTKALAVETAVQAEVATPQAPAAPPVDASQDAVPDAAAMQPGQQEIPAPPPAGGAADAVLSATTAPSVTTAATPPAAQANVPPAENSLPPPAAGSSSEPQEMPIE